MSRHDEMRHDITDGPECTGAGRGPGVRWQGGKVLLQPLGLGLDDCDTFCLSGHGFSLLAVACRTNGRHVPLCIGANALMCFLTQVSRSVGLGKELPMAHQVRPHPEHA